MTWDDDSPKRTQARRSSSVPFLPIVLIAIGVSVLFDQLVGRGFAAWDVFWFAVGIWCLARGRDDGPYPLLVIGAFLVGNNAGELAGAFVSRDMADATETLGGAAGFFWLFTSDRPRSRWAIWPAGILGFIGMAELGAAVTDLAPGDGGWLMPAGVIVAGILLLGAHRLPGPIRLAGLVFVIAAALSLLGDDDNDGRRGGIIRRDPPTTLAAPPLQLDGRTLRIEGDNGPVIVNPGNAAVIAGVIVNSGDPDEVVVRPRSANTGVVVSVPAGTPLEIEVDNGSVTVLSPTNRADISTDNGAINIIIEGDPDIDAESDGGVTVEGTPEGEDYEFDGGTEGEVELTSDNAPIVITRAPAATGAR